MLHMHLATDDDNDGTIRQRLLVVWPLYTMCRRTSNKEINKVTWIKYNGVSLLQKLKLVITKNRKYSNTNQQLCKLWLAQGRWTNIIRSKENYYQYMQDKDQNKRMK